MAGKAGAKIYGSTRWRRLRKQILERDGWRCTECGRAGRLECHHLEKITSAEKWFDPSNLAAICRSCHIKKTRQERRDFEMNKKSEARQEFLKMAGAM